MRSTVQELLDGLHAAADAPERRRWAAACARGLGLGGLAVSVGQELVWFSDDTSARLEDLQFVFGQGPSRHLAEATGTREFPDLTRLLQMQWPQFAAAAEELGIAALFVWPLHIGAVRVGTMTGYRRATGPLTARESSDGRVVADALARQLLDGWPDNGEPDRVCGAGAGSVGLHRAEVHQATGVLSELLGIPLAEALDRLRARAFASGRSLPDSARHILQQELPRDDV
ncbi:ANTAR domain-containing protein [Streptomyces sp. NPDC049813]|uniref:ANTAR domain-containing protein n=1 Tax=Streptomyces sp. NPDC049813 TaxID=3365597 RepID=UPI0037A21727